LAADWILSKKHWLAGESGVSRLRETYLFASLLV
jgi:hypothetical protein